MIDPNKSKLYGPDNKPIPIDIDLAEGSVSTEKQELEAFLTYREEIIIKGVKFRVKSFGAKILILEIVGNLKMNPRKKFGKRKQK